jgi:hypothetical protein
VAIGTHDLDNIEGAHPISLFLRARRFFFSRQLFSANAELAGVCDHFPGAREAFVLMLRISAQLANKTKHNTTREISASLRT